MFMVTHRHAPDLWPSTKPTVASGLAEFDQLMVDIADLTDRGATID
tara:strand:+ start:149 stop:286 length:138 start_codon:yes stop_codon:yes gene_type:complete